MNNQLLFSNKPYSSLIIIGGNFLFFLMYFFIPLPNLQCFFADEGTLVQVPCTATNTLFKSARNFVEFFGYGIENFLIILCILVSFIGAVFSFFLYNRRKSLITFLGISCLISNLIMGFVFIYINYIMFEEGERYNVGYLLPLGFFLILVVLISSLILSITSKSKKNLEASYES